MSILERNTANDDLSMWDSKIKEARRNHTPLPTLEDRTAYGYLHIKGLRFTATSEDTVMREVVVYGTDDQGNPVPGTEQHMEEPDVLVGREINDANIRVGNSVLIWQETHVPYPKSA